MEKIRIEFVVKDIEYIEFTPVITLNFKHYDIIPETRKWFGTTVDRKELRDGWSINGHPYYDDYYNHEWIDWYSTVKLERRGYFQVGEYDKNKPWYAKARVLIQKENNNHVAHFKTNEDAEIYLEEIKEMCSENFKVIINE